MVDVRQFGKLAYRLPRGKPSPDFGDPVVWFPPPTEVSVMKSFIKFGLLCVAVLAASSTTLLAQGGRGGGMGRGAGGYSRVQLATLKEVQAELKLNDEQKKAATEAVEKMTAARRELFSAGPGGDPTEMREKMAKLTSEADAALTAKLDDAQKKRLMEIFVQKNPMGMALADAEVQKALGLSEEAIKKVAEAQAANREAMMNAGLRDASPEERQQKMETLTKEANERFYSAISAEQKAAFEKLGGEKLEVDVTPLQPQRRGGGGPGSRANN